MGRFIVSLDQGTTSSRALLFDENRTLVALSQKPFEQIYPKPGWVEHDPSEILKTCLFVLKDVLSSADVSASEVVGLGITNQRETFVVWERATGEPIANAIVWQDRRTSAECQLLKSQGQVSMVGEKTGLLLDPYFSASKLKWLLDHCDGARVRAEAGELCFGTIDSWLIWHLTGGQSHKTDATNASRTMLYNIQRGVWDDDLLALFEIPRSLLPEVMNCADSYGFIDETLLGAHIPILGVAGDQQAALIGQACFSPGQMKSTYGTGCFALMNIGETPVLSKNNLLTTMAYQIEGQRVFALEGSIYIAGAAVQWLRDELKLIDKASECDDLALLSNPDDPVCLVPAFTGLGAPYWQADVRGALLNLTRGTGRAEIVRASLEAVGLQTFDLYKAILADWPDLAQSQLELRVDGGMVHSTWTMQFLADILNCPIEVPGLSETTALGAAYLAGFQAGLYPGFEEFATSWRAETRYLPQMSEEQRAKKYQIWRDAIGMLAPQVV